LQEKLHGRDRGAEVVGPGPLSSQVRFPLGGAP
jgi:hypothetical protein